MALVVAETHAQQHLQVYKPTERADEAASEYLESKSWKVQYDDRRKKRRLNGETEALEKWMSSAMKEDLDHSQDQPWEVFAPRAHANLRVHAARVWLHAKPTTYLWDARAQVRRKEGYKDLYVVITSVLFLAPKVCVLSKVYSRKADKSQVCQPLWWALDYQAVRCPAFIWSDCICTPRTYVDNRARHPDGAARVPSDVFLCHAR